ncbi:trans-sialidase [Trypanosoma cruzi Dm28c]|uniref:Trans-sialidase n=2 Tax=Trypanosoma cruzi TaxID=5693 RepID=V5B787_TRYCR|nr:trans-sialidase [Trypanosoma cruzi Dm28c]PBJ79537.1 trans-sialidase [Trypanosoma cruzi cruzi]PWV03198.1 putative trans-sialidase, Group V [Trypanosoma cruzi]
MLSRVAAVMAPRTHNRRRVTGSSGRWEGGGESERQRPNMSRRVFASAVLLLLVMVCCGTGGAAASDAQSSEPNYKWKDVKNEGGDVTVDSLGVPGLLKVGSDVFAVAEAQWKKNGNTVFTGIASQLLSMEGDKEPEEVLKDAKDTQILEEGGSEESKKKVDVSRPTTAVKGSDIYMLVGKHNHDAADTCQADAEKIKSGMLLVKGKVSGEDENKQIHWKDTDGVPCTLGAEHESLTGLVGGGGSGVKLKDGKLVFPVEGTKKKDADTEEGGKTVSLILYFSDTTSWTLSKGMSADGCSVPSVVEWKGKLMTMTACDDGRRRVYEIGDKGDSWTEALGTLSRVWANKHKGNVKRVRSGFTTANIGDGDGKRNVMLVTLPVYSEKTERVSANEKGVLHLWLTDNTHIVDIGPVSGETEDAAASSLLYKGGDNNEERLIALYEKKKVDADTPSPGMVSVRLTEQLKRVKDVLTTWKEVDERVSKLCLFSSATVSKSTGTACSTDKITAGLVGFLSGNFSDNTWKDEYLGVNATVTNKDGTATVATENSDGVKFTGRGAWAEWPVGKQGENQLYHFANYNFTLVATVSIDKVPKEGSIPLIGVKMDDDENTVPLGLSYNKEKKWILLCSGKTTTEHSSNWEPQTQYQVAIVLQNGTQGSAYVDGEHVGNVQCELENTDSKGISHFYIGGDGGSAENTAGHEGVSVTVTNVLLYNRPLTSEEIDALNPNKVTISSPEDLTAAVVVDIPSTAVSGSVEQKTVSVSTPGGYTVNHESSVSSGENVGTVGGTDEQGEKGIHPQHGEVNATALNSSLGKLSQGNNSDACTVRGSGLLSSLLLLLLGLWVFAAI